MRPIDADEITATLEIAISMMENTKSIIGVENLPVIDVEIKAYTDILKGIKEQPTVQPEPQWIPVSERMPEDYVDVLVWFEYFRYGDYNCLYQTHGIGTYVAEYNSWMINHESGWKDLRVIAWMPLPTPYTK